MSQENNRIAAAIDLRMRQLEKQGIQGAAIFDHMLGYMQGLQQIYDTASDKVLADLCQHYPGFYRYADMMESMSEKNQQMVEAGTHPYRGQPELPEKLKRSLAALMSSAADLERAFQSAVDSGGFPRQADQLDSLKRQWGADLQRLVELFRSSDVAPESQMVVQNALKAMAERINRLG